MLTVVATMTDKLAGLNLPAHADKRRLLPPGMRAAAAFTSLNKNKRGIVGITELATISRLSIKARRRWALVDAAPNNVFGLNRIGNAVAFRTDLYELVWRRNVKVPMPGRRRGLNLLVVGLRCLATGRMVCVISFHAPRKKLDPATNKRVLIEVAEWLAQWQDKGVTGYAIGDTNNYVLASYLFREAGAKELNHDDVVVLAGVNCTLVTASRTEGRYSDHGIPMADTNPKPKT